MVQPRAHMDLVGPMPASEGFTHLFTVVDITTRWAEAVTLQSTSAAVCSWALFHCGLKDTLPARWAGSFWADHFPFPWVMLGLGNVLETIAIDTQPFRNS